MDAALNLSSEPLYVYSRGEGAGTLDAFGPASQVLSLTATGSTSSGEIALTPAPPGFLVVYRDTLSLIVDRLDEGGGFVARSSFQGGADAVTHPVATCANALCTIAWSVEGQGILARMYDLGSNTFTDASNQLIIPNGVLPAVSSQNNDMIIFALQDQPPMPVEVRANDIGFTPVTPILHGGIPPDPLEASALSCMSPMCVAIVQLTSGTHALPFDEAGEGPAAFELGASTGRVPRVGQDGTCFYVTQ
jgi:hypothetical protein